MVVHAVPRAEIEMRATCRAHTTPRARPGRTARGTSGRARAVKDARCGHMGHGCAGSRQGCNTKRGRGLPRLARAPAARAAAAAATVVPPTSYFERLSLPFSQRGAQPLIRRVQVADVAKLLGGSGTARVEVGMKRS
jgi:hypothetical protein